MIKLNNFLAIIVISALTSTVLFAQQVQRQAAPPPAVTGALMEAIQADVNRVFDLINANTPAKLVDRETKKPVTDYTKINENTIFEPGRWGLLTYEWGVTYSAMLSAAEIFDDKRYSDYVYDRFNIIGDVYPYYVKLVNETTDVTTRSGTPFPIRGRNIMMRGLIAPIWLDDCGSMQAAFVKGVIANPQLAKKLRPIIDVTFDFAMYKEHRLKDGTLARARPDDPALWVDDMYMGIPPIAYMAKLLEKEKPDLAKKYYDEAALQIELFRKYLWMPEKKLFKHSWVESMTTYRPPMYWGRANGWALLCMSDVLDVLPDNHPKRPAVMNALLELMHGMMELQGGDGFLHQVLDRFDSYTETSVTAMFAYVLAHAVNEGWVDIFAYGPAAVAAWKAVASRINAQGEVEGICIATGVSYEPGYYYQRPTSVNAPHGYGPVILAGSEVLKMLRTAPRFYDGGALLQR